MTQELWPSQKKALERLKPGSILAGGVGSGKSRTAIAYWMRDFYEKDLLIITTAMKRDSKEWEKDLAALGAYSDRDKARITIESWNKIQSFVGIEGYFVILDEQRLVGSGTWVKSFLTIAKKNPWILLSGTPGDSWMDYVPVFLANGFYKNRSEFYRDHVIFNRFTKYPKVDRYIGERKLDRLRRRVLVPMPVTRPAKRHILTVQAWYDQELYDAGTKRRFDFYKDEPMQGASALCYFQRKVANSSEERYDKCLQICRDNPRVVIFYSFDYELEILRGLSDDLGGRASFERNGHRHDKVDESLREWLFLVQYASGSEAWNCTTTDTMILFSQTYSWKVREQAMGRIDRMNTSYRDLYYYELRSKASIDDAIRASIERKKVFNEKAYAQKAGLSA